MTNDRRTILPELLSPQDFNEFSDRLYRVMFDGKSDRVTGSCDHSLDQTRRILTELGHADKLDQLLELFRHAGGYCDCEVGFNVLARPERLFERWHASAA